MDDSLARLEKDRAVLTSKELAHAAAKRQWNSGRYAVKVAWPLVQSPPTRPAHPLPVIKTMR
jgi:hypothetical protein